MEINITNNEVKTIRRLGNAVNAGIVPVNDIRAFLNGLQQKLGAPAAPGRNSKKPERKEHYKQKLRVA